MKRAFVSDIHGNEEALAAVEQDMKLQGVDDIVCLGDVIGYGPDPVACAMWVIAKARIWMLGNHDRGSLEEPSPLFWYPHALAAIKWTTAQIAAALEKEQIFSKIRGIPKRIEEDQFLYVHASPRTPVDEYLFPDDPYDPDGYGGRYEESGIEKLAANFALVKRFAFCGHTHFPGVFTQDGIVPTTFRSQADLGQDEFSLEPAKAIINVGSVGQPRDEDNRACYLIVDTEKMTGRYRRIQYDYEITANKVRRIEGLGEFGESLAKRLVQGR